MGLAVGLAVGAFNQWYLWRSLARLHGERRAVVGGALARFALRLALDAGALYAAWLLTRAAAGLVAAAAGLLATTAVSTWRQYLLLRRGVRNG